MPATRRRRETRPPLRKERARMGHPRAIQSRAIRSWSSCLIIYTLAKLLASSTPSKICISLTASNGGSGRELCRGALRGCVRGAWCICIWRLKSGRPLTICTNTLCGHDRRLAGTNCASASNASVTRWKIFCRASTRYGATIWTAAYDLHKHALRTRSQVSWHELRIGIKRFRYTVENFLPRQHALWGDDLDGRLRSAQTRSADTIAG